MSGIFQGSEQKDRITASRLRVRHTRLVFCLMSLLLDWRSYLFAEHGLPAYHRVMRLLFNSRSQTGIECQLETC